MAMTNVRLIYFVLFSSIFFNYTLSSWTPPFLQRDFLFFPKLTSINQNSENFAAASGVGVDPKASDASKTVIYNHSKLDPDNQNVYQDSTTAKVIKNQQKEQPNNQQGQGQSRSGSSSRNHVVEEEIIIDDPKDSKDGSNKYVPVMMRRKNLASGTIINDENDLSLQGNNFQVNKYNNDNGNDGKNGKKRRQHSSNHHPLDHFVDAEVLFKSNNNNNHQRQQQQQKNSRPGTILTNHKNRNVNTNVFRRNNNNNNNYNNPDSDLIPDNPIEVPKEFEDLFKLDDFKDFFNSKIFE